MITRQGGLNRANHEVYMGRLCAVTKTQRLSKTDPARRKNPRYLMRAGPGEEDYKDDIHTRISSDLKIVGICKGEASLTDWRVQ